MSTLRHWWEKPTKEDLSDIHHALRIAVKHPLMGDAERQRYTYLADCLWEGYFCQPESHP